MSELLNKILKFMIEKEWDDSAIAQIMNDSICLSGAIAFYAHEGQFRVNGERYVSHPFSMMEKYYNYIGTVCDQPYYNLDMLDEYGIPLRGVAELCLLHDVVEDSELSLEDVESLFIECGFENYFEVWIKKPLELITHDKSEEYPMYIFKCSLTPQSALVKMLDMQDNCNMFTLDTLSEDNLHRSQSYLQYIYALNNKYNFIENGNNYRAKFFKEIHKEEN